MYNVINPMELRYLNEKQAETIVRWKNQTVSESNWRKWCNYHVEGKREIRRIFREVDFFAGGIMKVEQIDEIFQACIQGQGGRALNRTLYTKNDPKAFNQALRNLLDEDEPLPKRFENFLSLHGAGIWTTSQLLCKWYPEIHPFIATMNGRGFMDETLFNNIPATKLKLATDDAMKHYKIDQRLRYSNTVKYLTYSMILREIRDFIELESFLEIQNILWDAFSKQKQLLPRGTTKPAITREEKRRTRRKSGQVTIPPIEVIAESSRWAVDKVIKYEEMQDRRPYDVSDKPRGYDIESVDKRSGDARYIEVKSRRGGSLVVMTDNECRVAGRLGTKYFLYVVTADNIFIIRNPIKVCSKEKKVRIVWTITDWIEKSKKVGIF